MCAIILQLLECKAALNCFLPNLALEIEKTFKAFPHLKTKCELEKKEEERRSGGERE